MCSSLLARLIHEGGARLNHSTVHRGLGGGGGNAVGSFFSPHSSATIFFFSFLLALPGACRNTGSIGCGDAKTIDQVEISRSSN